jgi:hypothetical protein
MAMSDQEDEFYEDFGTPSFTDAQLEELLLRARETNDVTLRRLVKQLRTLRLAAEAALQSVEAAANLDVLKVDAHMTRLRSLVGKR